MIRHDRRRWSILIVASVGYLCSHSYVFGIMATIGLDVLVNVASLLVAGSTLWSSREWLVLDVLIRMATIVIGVTINAFSSYVFDLSYFYGMQWIFFAVVVLLYVYVRLVDWGSGAWNKSYNRPTWGVDYIFGLASLGAMAFFMNFVAFGEPYTFMVEMIYIASVIALTAVSDVKKMQWWAFLIFVVFWAVAIIVALIINIQLDKDFRFPLAYYFTKTPLIN